jgi:hypothetical protein
LNGAVLVGVGGIVMENVELEYVALMLGMDVKLEVVVLVGKEVAMT